MRKSFCGGISSSSRHRQGVISSLIACKRRCNLSRIMAHFRLRVMFPPSSPSSIHPVPSRATSLPPAEPTCIPSIAVQSGRSQSHHQRRRRRRDGGWHEVKVGGGWVGSLGCGAAADSPIGRSVGRKVRLATGCIGPIIEADL